MKIRLIEQSSAENRRDRNPKNYIRLKWRTVQPVAANHPRLENQAAHESSFAFATPAHPRKTKWEKLGQATTATTAHAGPVHGSRAGT